VRELLQRAEIPLEDVDLPLGIFARQAEEEVSQRFALAVLVGVERDARVEVPADDEDSLLRGLQGGGDDVVIIAGVDDHRRLLGARDAPAIAPQRHNRLQRRPLSLPVRHDDQKR
jgi:hypothetical protein